MVIGAHKNYVGRSPYRRAGGLLCPVLLAVVFAGIAILGVAVAAEPSAPPQSATLQPAAVPAGPVSAEPPAVLPVHAPGTPPASTTAATSALPAVSASQPERHAVAAQAEASPAIPVGGSWFTPEELEPLLQRLEADGIPRGVLTSVFYDQRLRRIDRVITYNVLNPDSARIYEQFLEPFAIKLAKAYRIRHARELNALQQRYGVSPEVIVGILLVETQFGTAALRYRLLEVFTTLILDASPEAVERNYQRLKADYPDLDRAWIEARLQKKAAWAYEELKALLSIRDRLSVASLYEVKGSYAGAFGMPQFMPSSYQQWAVDGNQDLRVDLDNPADAMASIANFLYQHGWRADAPLEQKMRAVWEYNRSMHYVRTIFQVALSMTRPSPKRGSASAETGPRAGEADGRATVLASHRINEAAQHLAENPVLTPLPAADSAVETPGPTPDVGVIPLAPNAAIGTTPY